MVTSERKLSKVNKIGVNPLKTTEASTQILFQLDVTGRSAHLAFDHRTLPHSINQIEVVLVVDILVHSFKVNTSM
jgi:hypothetical protein